MKIKTKPMSLKEALSRPVPPHKNPLRQGLFFRTLIRLAASGDLKDADFTYTRHNMKDSEDRPCLILMNHSAFIDLEIVSKIFYPRPYSIVCTSDGFVGKEWLMRRLGCIPTKKFVSDLGLIRDMEYALKRLRQSVLMYPEASYSFDGCATPLPEGFGRLLKRLAVPVVMIKTYGAFLRDPLYNCLQKRKVKVGADVECILSSEEAKELSVGEIDEILSRSFDFDGFAYQRDNAISVNEPFRADGLERILYKCAACGAEGQTKGAGSEFFCRACGKKYVLTPHGELTALEGETEFSHIPDWYRAEREQVRRDAENGTYRMKTHVKIAVMRDYKAIYTVGEGTLLHSCDGFELTDSDGNLIYAQKPQASYSLYADYFWYELGDVICIGDKDTLYYCFPQDGTPVAKARLAAEELYKIARERIKSHRES